MSADLPLDAAAFASQLLPLTRLTALHLVDSLNHGGAGTVLPNLLRLRRLRTLHLDTALADQAALATLHISLSSFHHLRDLQLIQHGCPLESPSRNIPDHSLAALALPSGLTALCLEHHRWGSAALGVLCGRVGALPRLQALALTDCAIGADGAKWLRAALLSLSTLTSLRLATQGFMAVGVASIVPGIAGMTTLKELSLDGNRMASNGAAVLGPVLGQLTGLERLNLRKNRLGGAGMAALAPHIARLSRLTWLELTNNHLDEDGAAALARHLPSLPFLREAHLQHLSDFSGGLPAGLADVVRKALVCRPMARVL
jgi:Leucine Rich repeat